MNSSALRFAHGLPEPFARRDMKEIRVLVWGENVHENKNATVRSHYPLGMHEAIAATVRQEVANSVVSTATLQEPEHGLTNARLSETDVLIWWGHLAHGEVQDEVAQRVCRRVLAGMGLIVLHSGHFSKVFKALMGTGCTLKWREATDKERIWNIMPAHPIMEGIGDYFELSREEMYGEFFDIPTPDELLMISWFSGGEVFRSGATWQRGHGRVFYFRPGHESFPTYHDANVKRVIANSVRWANPNFYREETCPNATPLEKLPVVE
jgi:trehalose utilization protein